MNEPIRSGDVTLALVYGKGCPDPRKMFPNNYLRQISDTEIAEARAQLVRAPTYPPLAPIPPRPRVRHRDYPHGCIFW